MLISLKSLKSYIDTLFFYDLNEIIKCIKFKGELRFKLIKIRNFLFSYIYFNECYFWEVFKIMKIVEQKYGKLKLNKKTNDEEKSYSEF